MRSSIIYVSLYIPWLICLAGGQNDIYYCQTSTQTISGQSQGVIRTRETKDDPYGNNLRCSWRITADEGQLIQLKIKSSDLEWSPLYTTCSGYDNLRIYDGGSTDEPELTSACGARNPFNIISRSKELFLVFSTTHQNFGDPSGVELSFETFSNNTCPPSWFQAPGSPDACFLIGSWGKAHWRRAYDVCTYSSGLLATINTEEEYNTILDHGGNLSVPSAWIGLNNLANSGRFEWIETAPLVFQKEVNDQSYEAHCVSMHFPSGSWHANICEDNLLNYVCRRNKDGSPMQVQEFFNKSPDLKDAPEGSKGYLAVIIVVVLLVFAVLLGLFVYCHYIRTGRCKKRRSGGDRSDKTTEPEPTTADVPLSNVHVPLSNIEPVSRPSAPPASGTDVMLHDPQMVAPPTYEEAQYHPVAPSCY